MSDHKVEIDVRLKTDKVSEDFDEIEKQAEKGAKSVSDSMDDMQESMDDTADKAKKSAKEIEGAYDKLIQTVQKQQDEVKALKEEYKKAVVEYGETSDEAKKLASKLEEVSAELAQNKAQLQKASDAADQYDKSIDNLSDSLGEGADKAGMFGDILKGSLASAAIEKGVGAVTGMISNAVTETLELDDASNKLQASIGATADEMEGYNEVMQEMYNEGYGDSISEIADTMALVKQYTGEIDPSSMKELAENAMTLDETFSGMDMEETLRGADALMKNMGLTAEESFDYIVVGAQNGLNKSNELADNLAEYSQIWAQAGFGAQEMFTILDNGLSSGAYNLDKVNDFVKEFTISLSDGRIEENIGSFSSQTQGLFAAWKNGEATTKDVFYSIINDLASMENQQEALTIASNTWSALGEDNAMKVITSLTEVNDKYKDVKGSMNDLKNVRTDSLQNQYKKLGRTLQTEILQPLAKKILPVAKEGLEFIADNLDKIIPLAGAVGAAMATIWVTKKVQSFIGKIKDTASAIVGLITQTTAQAAATGTATVAQEGLNVAMNANPIGLVVTAIAALVAGLAAFSALVGQDDASKFADEMEESRKAAEEARDEYAELSDEYHKQSDEVMNLWRKLEDLSEVENKSASQKEEMSRLVDELNKKVPELGLQYDELNDTLSETVESIDAVVRAAAGQEAYDSAVEARTEAAKEYNAAVADQKEAEQKLTEATKKLGDEIAENYQYYQTYGETINGTRGDVENYRKALDDANAAVEETSEKLEQAALDEQYYGLMVADLDSKTRDLVNTTLAQIDGLNRTDEAYAQSVEALSVMTDTHTAAKESIQANIDGINAKIDALKQKYSEAKESAYDSISGQLGLFNTMTVESTMSIDQMLGALDTQISYLDTFSANMQTAIAMGVDEGLLAQLSDGSAESAAILQEIVNSGQEKITGPGGLNEKFAAVEEGKRKFSEQMAELKTNFSDTMTALETELADAQAKMDLEDEAFSDAVDTIQGFPVRKSFPLNCTIL